MSKAQYNEGNLISTMDNPVWSMKRTGVPITPTHIPDRYWFKIKHNVDGRGKGVLGGSAGGVPNQMGLVAEHSPGFFSCLWHNGRLYMGTYSGGTHGKCQLCRLDGNKVTVVHTFDGESVYHLRGFEDYMIMPIEQGNLYRRDDDGTITKLRDRSMTMGFYDFCWLDSHWYAVEKMNVHPPNQVAIYKDNNDWFTSTDWKAKDMMPLNGKLYLSATGIGGSAEDDGSAAIVQIDPVTKAETFVTSQYHNCWTGGLGIYDGKAWATIDCNGKVFNSAGWSQNLGDQGWFVGEIDGNLFATTGGKWRGTGPSHLYIFQKDQNKFVKLMDFPDAEPWSMCRGESSGVYYLVTRNQQGSLGRVYRLSNAELHINDDTGDEPDTEPCYDAGGRVNCSDEDTLDIA